MASEETLPPLEQLPIRWNDRSLLAHVPFRDLLTLADELYIPRNMETHQLIRLALEKGHKEFIRAFIRWCLIVFEPVKGERPKILPNAMDFVKDPEYWKLFVEVFHGLSRRENEGKVLYLLNDRRKKLGYNYFFEIGVERRHSVSSKRKHALSSCLSSQTAPSNANGATPAAHAVLETTGQFTDGEVPTEPKFARSADEIEAAAEAFMNMLPDGDSGLTEYSECRMRTRKSAPSRDRLAELARKDDEHAQEVKSDVQRKQKRKQRHRQSAKPKIPRSIETNGKQVSVRKSSKVIGIGVETSEKCFEIAEPDQTPTDAEAIVVDNAVSANSLTDLLIDKGSKRREKDLCQTPKSKKQKRSDSDKETRLQASSSARNLPKASSQNAKLSSSNRQKIKETNVAAGAEANVYGNSFESDQDSSRWSSSVELSNKNRHYSIMESNEIWHPSSREIPFNLENERTYSWSGSHSMTFFGVTRPSSTSSDETLVDLVVNEGKDSASKTGRGGDDFHISKVTVVEHDPVEDQIRLEKMAASLKMSRLDASLSKASIPEGRRPLIWAASRQAMCETTSWFRAYHGGVYFSDGKARGYLLGGFSSQRDIFCHNGRFIISHGGGKSLDSTGQRDQDNSVRALLYNFRQGHPLVLIVDNNYARFPFDLGQMMYVVLGLYWIVDAWAEKDVSEINGKLETRIKYKFAFQYCDGQGSPWWLDAQSDWSSNQSHPPSPPLTNPDKLEVLSGDTGSDACAENGCSMSPVRDMVEHETGDMSTVDKVTCSQCGKRSPRIYKQGWMCLHPDCPSFFRIDSEEVFSLDFEEQFLELRPALNLGKIDLSLPTSICMPDYSADSIYSTKGWWCSNCGELCPREKWECWECLRCKIRFPSSNVPLPIRGHKEFCNQELDLKGHKVYKIYDGSGIAVSTRKWTASEGRESGLCYIFKLPDALGQIYLICGNARANQCANFLFSKYQMDARDRPFLRRYPLRFHHARGRMLTNYFSHNAGVPYEYAVTTNVTDPFDQAPPSVNGALQLIKDRVSSVVCKDADFNEILTAAYMAEQKMSYHTDDERGLGPVVASLSLGSIAFMHFRHRRTATNSNADKQLTVILRHGDVLVMQGAAIQRLYEHTVVPMNFRIAATARCIEQAPIRLDPRWTPHD